MKEKFVIAYYGKRYTKVYSNPTGWKDQYIGEGIVHESKPSEFYPSANMIKQFEPKEKYEYAKIEKRFYQG